MSNLFDVVAQTSHLDPKAAQSQDTTLFEDFLSYTTAVTSPFSTGPSGSGTTAWDGTAIGDQGTGHNVLITTQASTQWDKQGVATTNALFLPVATGPAMGCEAHISFTSQSANNAMIFFGFVSTTAIHPASNVDPSASYSGAIIYRLSGDTQWRVQVSNGSTKTTKTCANAGGLCADGEYTLRVEIMPFDALNCAATFFVNGNILTDSFNNPLQLKFLYASLAAMKIMASCEAATANAQTLLVDYITANASRGQLIKNG